MSVVNQDSVQSICYCVNLWAGALRCVKGAGMRGVREERIGFVPLGESLLIVSLAVYNKNRQTRCLVLG